jgi:hypothetical protein
VTQASGALGHLTNGTQSPAALRNQCVPRNRLSIKSMATVQLVADLVWSGNDGFDPEGRRVASVARFSQNSPAGPGCDVWFVARRYWMALVAYNGRFDYVLVDGEPGCWAKKDEAKAAADSAHRSWVRKFPPNNTASVAGEDGAQAGHGHSEGAPGPGRNKPHKSCTPWSALDDLPTKAASHAQLPSGWCRTSGWRSGL